MLITVPISRADAKLADSFVKSLEKFSVGANHNLLIVASPNAKELANDLLAKIKGHFVNSALEIFVGDNDFGWPRASNFYFQQTCYIIPKYCKPTQGWLWMELDSVPLMKDWLTILEQEYYADSQAAHQQSRQAYRYLGTTEKTIKAYGGELADDGTHMASCGIYPGDFSSICAVMNSLPSVGKHFSAHIKWYTTIFKGTPQLNVSPLIQDNRDTANYRLEKGKIICDSVAKNAWGLHWNEEVSDQAILLHGCKDSSLIDVVLEDRKVNFVQRDSSNVGIKSNPTFGNPQNLQIAVSPPVASTPKSTTPKEETTRVVHPQLAKPANVRGFGSFSETGASKAQVQFDSKGNLVLPKVERVIAEDSTTSTVVTPQIPAPVEPPKLQDVIVQQAKRKSSPKKSRRGRTGTMSEENRTAQGQRMRDMWAAKKQSKELQLA
jgi:hypothetical protein